MIWCCTMTKKEKNQCPPFLPTHHCFKGNDVLGVAPHLCIFKANIAHFHCTSDLKSLKQKKLPARSLDSNTQQGIVHFLPYVLTKSLVAMLNLRPTTPVSKSLNLAQCQVLLPSIPSCYIFSVNSCALSPI